MSSDTQNMIASFGMMNGMSHVMHVTQKELMEAFAFENKIINAFLSLLISSLVASAFMNGMGFFKTIIEFIKKTLILVLSRNNVPIENFTQSNIMSSHVCMHK